MCGIELTELASHFWCSITNPSDDKFSLYGQVINQVGDLIGIKYSPAGSDKQHQEQGAMKLEWDSRIPSRWNCSMTWKLRSNNLSSIYVQHWLEFLLRIRKCCSCLASIEAFLLFIYVLSCRVLCSLTVNLLSALIRTSSYLISMSSTRICSCLFCL